MASAANKSLEGGLGKELFTMLWNYLLQQRAETDLLLQGLKVLREIQDDEGITPDALGNGVLEILKQMGFTGTKEDLEAEVGKPSVKREDDLLKMFYLLRKVLIGSLDADNCPADCT